MPLAALPRAAEHRPLLAAAADALWLAAAALLVGVSLLLILRRLAGAFAIPLPPLGMAAAGAGAALLTAAVRRGWRARGGYGCPGAVRYQVEAAASVLVLGFALALSLPGSGVLGLVLLWAAVVAEEALTWPFVAGRPTANRAPHDDATIVQHAADPIGDAPPAEGVTQQLARRATPAGIEEIGGWLRMPLAAGQQSGSLHVAFCPPLAAPPEIEIEQAAGPAARIKLGQALSCGARIDVKLAAPAAAATSLLVQFFARSRGVGSQRS